MDPQPSDPERPPIKVVITITALLTLAAVAQTLAHFWAALSWLPTFAAAAALSALHRIRPSPTAVTIRHRLLATPGWPSRALHRVLDRIGQRIQRHRTGETQADAEYQHPDGEGR